jgi:hypothetical protein
MRHTARRAALPTPLPCNPPRHPPLPLAVYGRALLDAQKAPKRIDDSSALAPSAAPPSSSQPPHTGSVWNTGGTFEERDVSAWALAELRTRLGGLAVDVCGGELRVSSVSGVDGSCSIVSNRGKLKRPFELQATLAWEFADGDPAHACEGTVAYTEVSPAPPSAARPVTCERAERLTKPPASAVVGFADAARAALEQRFDEAMRGFVDALAAK